MLIALCKKFNDQFETGVKKHIWKKISSELTKNCQRMYTYQQCDTKFKVLKNMYKSVRKYNSQSGNNKKSWEYYGLMDDIMFNKPEICPVATCSSARGLITNGLQEQDTNIEVSRPSACSTPLSARELDENSTTTNVMRKRKHYENATERRHQEKMSRQDRYLSLLERITVAVERSSTTS
ncbi:unnamed protein product [Psylliodes chrysocephalus]|uniref:Myb/SANT-like DNA-binding domain-containing protein n=1 Tax=Psylliodes chrysocephalus TaxID=3402493 RepID=A0A9P0D0Q7_9CUCU|nr:unnamed protein product [Psylliodes chrysocephala]